MKTTVGVLRGGTSKEYPLSLKTGAEYLRALSPETYTVLDIFVDSNGVWHVRGIPKTPVDALIGVDVVINALHGGMGEDGTVSRFLSQQGMAFTGSHAPASVIAYNKAQTNIFLSRADILVPQGMSFSIDSAMHTGDMASLVFERYAPPYIIKPLTQGHSFGSRVVNSIYALPDALGDVIDEYGDALVQEYVFGTLVSVFILEQFRNQDLYVFPVIEHLLPEVRSITQPQNYLDNTLRHRVPSHLSFDQKHIIEETARRVFESLNLRHHAHIDMIVSPRGIFVTDVDTTPALHSASGLQQSVESIGTSLVDYTNHLVTLAQV